jgi:predicted PurR-regulated permease PerM
MTTPASRDLLRITLALFFICLMTLASLWILQPFLPALTWATMVVVATWPLMLRVQRWLRNRRMLAVAAMTVAMLTVFVVPLVAAVAMIIDNADEIGHWVASLADIHLPSPPDWLKNIPFVGASADATWRDIATAGPEEIARRLKPYSADFVSWAASHAGGFGMLAIQLLLTVVLSAVLFARGEGAAAMVRRFAARLAGERGEGAVRLAGQAIRAVAIGVVGTALVQSLLGGIGLFFAGVPFVSLLTAMMLLLAIAQIGVVPVMLCAVGWLYWKDQNTAATVLLVWSGIVGILDNVLRPILIKQGADLPLLLIFAGVIGGLLAFGLVGLFVGPVILAVCYTLLRAWILEGSTSGPGRLP